MFSQPTTKQPNRATLPTEGIARKTFPIATGVLDYFPDAIAAVAQLSHKGNEQHNPGQPLHWNRSKSTDQDDTLMRHFLQRGTVDVDGVRHSAKVAWRALAILQLEIEADRNVPALEPGTVLYTHICGCRTADYSGCRMCGTYDATKEKGI